jgi:hypothetical protein
MSEPTEQPSIALQRQSSRFEPLPASPFAWNDVFSLQQPALASFVVRMRRPLANMSTLRSKWIRFDQIPPRVRDLSRLKTRVRAWRHPLLSAHRDRITVALARQAFRVLRPEAGEGIEHGRLHPSGLTRICSS